MNNIEKLSKLTDEKYQELFGVKKTTFNKMLSILQEAYEIQCKKGGKPLRALSIFDKLVIMLQYYREYLLCSILLLITEYQRPQFGKYPLGRRYFD